MASSSSTAVTPPRSSRGWLAGLLLVLLAVAAHGRSVWSGFIWDDEQYVTDNTTLRSRDGLRRIWLEPRSIPQYYPLVHTTFWLEYQLWGDRPTSYHVVNVVLHAANSLLLWRVLVPLSAARCAAFQDCETLWLDTLAKTPHCSGAANNLGALYQLQGRLDEAIPLLEHAARTAEAANLFDRIEADQKLAAKARLNLGVAHAKAGDIAAAVAAFREAVAGDPSSAEAHGNLGRALLASGDRAAALQHLERSRTLSGSPPAPDRLP